MELLFQLDGTVDFPTGEPINHTITLLVESSSLSLGSERSDGWRSAWVLGSCPELAGGI